MSACSPATVLREGERFAFPPWLLAGPENVVRGQDGSDEKVQDVLELPSTTGDARLPPSLLGEVDHDGCIVQGAGTNAAVLLSNHGLGAGVPVPTADLIPVDAERFEALKHNQPAIRNTLPEVFVHQVAVQDRLLPKRAVGVHREVGSIGSIDVNDPTVTIDPERQVTVVALERVRRFSRSGSSDHLLSSSQAAN